LQQQMSQHTTKPSSSSSTSSTLFHLPLIFSTFEGLLYFFLSLYSPSRRGREQNTTCCFFSFPVPLLLLIPRPLDLITTRNVIKFVRAEKSISKCQSTT
jgi:hypothetical protein